MSQVDMFLDNAFKEAGISAGERVPLAEELRARLRPAVKQAFIDAGWKQIGVTGTVMEQHVDRHEYVGANGGLNIPLMTGQEWYAKFEQELKGRVFPHHCSEDQANVLNVLTKCQGAAKKASGIAS